MAHSQEGHCWILTTAVDDFSAARVSVSRSSSTAAVAQVGQSPVNLCTGWTVEYGRLTARFTKLSTQNLSAFRWKRKTSDLKTLEMQPTEICEYNYWHQLYCNYKTCDPKNMSTVCKYVLVNGITRHNQLPVYSFKITTLWEGNCGFVTLPTNFDPVQNLDIVRVQP